MKAVILQIVKGKAVVMTEDGIVKRVRNKEYSVGDEIFMKENVFSNRRWAPVLAALLIFAMVGTGTWAYATPAYELSVVEKSGEELIIKVNRLEKVIGLERDGKPVELDEELENKDIEEVIRALLEKSELDEENVADVVITAMARNGEKAEEIAERIRERIENEREEAREKAEEARERAEERKELGEEKDDMDPREENVQVKGLSPAHVQRAKALGITPGRYNIITNLLGVEDRNFDDDPEEVDRNFKKHMEMSNQELMEIFTADKGEKNGVKFQDEEKDKKDNPSVNAPGQLKEKPEKVNDDLEEELEDELGRPEDAGKPEGVGKPENVGKPEGVGKPK